MTKVSTAQHPLVVLKEHGLRPTRLRIKILKVLMSEQKSFSFKEMHLYFEKGEDRVTIYRILNDLYTNGIVERIVDIDGIHRFVYYPECFGIHPSFRCRACGLVASLSPLPEYYLKELKEYFVDNAVLLFSGVCNQCKNKNR